MTTISGSNASNEASQHDLHHDALHHESAHHEAPHYDMPTSLTVPANGLTANHRSLDAAAAVAAQLDLPIRVVSLVDDGSGVPVRQRLLRRLTDTVPVDLTVTTTIDHGSDEAAFIMDAIAERSSLVVLSGGSSGFGIPGSVTHEVLRFASAPVMFTGPLCLNWDGPVSRIVVPIDGSRLAERCLPIAAAWARATSSPVEFVTVVDPAATTQVPVVTHDVLEAGLVNTVAQEFGSTYDITAYADVLHAAWSHRADAIAARAAEQLGTIVCMASNGSAHNPHTLATTTTRLVHLCPTPVIVVRS